MPALANHGAALIFFLAFNDERSLSHSRHRMAASEARCHEAAVAHRLGHKNSGGRPRTQARRSFDLFEQRLKTRVFAEWIQVVVVFQPTSVSEPGPHCALEVFHRFFEHSSE